MARTSRSRFWLVVVSGLLALGALGTPSFAKAAVKDDSGLYVPKPNHGAKAQIAELRSSHQKADAELVKSMIDTPQAVWFTQGTPKQVQKSVKATVKRAKGTVPVLVAYNIPGRDCANLSAGGALTTADYEAWIDGFASGIGNHKAVVILEPDGLGLLPSNCGAGFAFTDTQRYAQLKYAVDKIEAQPNAMVYLDGTHSAWLNVGDISTRLVQAGVQRAHGFFLNVSNYQFTPNLVQYGTWISKCIASGDYGGCPNQYWSGGPANGWVGTALSPYGEWSDTASDPALNTVGINSRYEQAFGNPQGTTHFVIDTSRNGQGPWRFPSTYPDAGAAQDWCNPPGRGVGIRPTLHTGVPLIDAYLWIKIPGESDGQCTRGGSVGTPDPEWGQVDPAAGHWFPDMALELARNAVPGF